MYANVNFRAQHEELVKGLVKVYFQFHYPKLFYKFGFNTTRNLITFDFGSPEIGDYSHNDFMMIFTELEDICCQQDCHFVLVSFCFHPYKTFFC